MLHARTDHHGGRSYRIGFLNLWDVSAENQCFASLQIAAGRLGHVLVYCRTSDEIEAAGLDFVIAASTYQPKLTSAPTFGNLHEGRARFWEHPDFFRTFLTYDGYLTISDSLARFATSMSIGLGRLPHAGFFYMAPQVSEFVADLPAIVERGEFQVCYFGTNWDQRARALFLAMSEKPYGRVQGPPASWDYLEGRRFFGSLPFDGVSVQRTYAAHGAGLVLLSREHLVDDVISNRLFEIASVGAVAICPRTPWIERTFGDSVYYYDTTETDLGVANQVEEAVQRILADPQEAASRGREARRIFETRFSADVLIPQAIAHFEDWRADRERRLAALPQPLIDVVVRAGSRPVKMVRKALESVDGQKAGRFRIILVLFRPLDVAELVAKAWTRIETVKVIQAPGGNRSATLRAGMNAVSSEYFAVLDDDDFWLDNHIESQLEALADADPHRGLALSGMIVSDSSAEPGRERRAIRFLNAPNGPIRSILGGVGIHTFLAASSLLRSEALENLDLETGEDTALIGSLLRAADVRFTYRPTAVQLIGRDDQSNYADRDDRVDDLLQAYLRIGPSMEEIERRLAQPGLSFWETSRILLDQAQASRRSVVTPPREPVAMRGGRLVRPLSQHSNLQARRLDLETPYLGIRTVRRRDVEGLPANESWFDEPWLFGLVARLEDIPDFEPAWLVAKLENVGGVIAALHLDLDSGEVLARDVTLEGIPDIELWLPVDRAVGAFVLQCWDKGLAKPAVLRELWAVRESELAGRQDPVRGVFQTQADRDREAAGREEAVVAFRAEELEWRRSLSRPVIAHDRAMAPLHRRADLSTSPICLNADAVSVPPDGGLDLPDGWTARVSMSPLAAAGDNAVSVDLFSSQIAPGDWVVVELGRTVQALPFLLIDDAGGTIRAVEAPGGRDGVELWLRTDPGIRAAALVLRHPERPLEDTVLIRRVTIARSVG